MPELVHPVRALTLAEQGLLELSVSSAILAYLASGEYSWSVVTDLAEVYRRGTAMEKENIAFRRHLAARSSAHTAFQILATEIEKQVDCTACANCCRHSLVAVNQAEIEDIALHLKATAEGVTRQFTDPDPGAPGFRILRTSDSGCVFLDGNLCMVYDARPKACREFPHVAVGTHSLGSRRASMNRWAPLCPIIFNALEAHKQVTGFRAGESPVDEVAGVDHT